MPFAVRAALVVLPLLVASCSVTGDAPCDGVRCGGSGTCVLLQGYPICQCDPGYRAFGLDCVPGGDAGAADSVDAPVGSTCSALIGHWPFDEESGPIAADTVGESPGSLQGAAAHVPGIAGGALEFSGTGYVEMAQSATLSPGLRSFSLEAWARIPAGVTGRRRIVAYGTHGGSAAGFALMEWDASWGEVPVGGVMLLLGLNGEYQVGTCSAMDDDTWHHYVATVDRGGSIRLYVDGEALAAPCTGLNAGATWNGAVPGSIAHLAHLPIDASCSFCVGASCQQNGACAPTEHFVGSVDQVALYGRVLGAGEIAANYGAGAGRTICP